MAAAVANAIPLKAPAPKLVRPRTLLIGTSLVVAGCIMAFAGLMGVYVSVRAAVLESGATWLPEGSSIPLTPGTITLFTFLLSAVTMHWSVYAIGNNDRSHALMALGLTMMFGFASINATAFLYTQMNLVIAESSAAVLIYVISGAHIAMTVAGLVFASLMTFRTLGGEYSGRDRDGILAAALFWYATIAIYPVIWYAIYVTK